MKTRTPNWLLAPLAVASLTACGVDRLTSAETTSEALLTAQCDFAGLDAAGTACRAAFDACVAVEGADLEDCRASLHACLPPPPHRPPPGDEGGGGCHGGDGQRPPPPPEGFDPEGGSRPPPPPEGFGPDGGLPPPPPLLPDGGRPPPPPHHGRGPRGPHPHPDPAAIEACRTALDACLLADPTDATCAETERACVRAAFEAAFVAACDEAASACTGDPTAPCARILERCAQGVAGGAPTCGDAG